MSKIDPETLEAAIERALAPYARVFPAKTLDKMRDEMRDYATNHPYPVALLRQLSPVVVQSSHVRGTDAGVGDTTEAGDAPLARAPLKRINGAGGGR